MSGYRTIVQNHSHELDWSGVNYLIGDERCVPEHHADSNWREVREELLEPLGVPHSRRFQPNGSVSAEEGASDYEKQLASIPEVSPGRPRLDHVWLGVGEDGHTLSLFPGHPAAERRDALVLPIHESPKPPPNRITLSLAALEGVATCVVLAMGAGKAHAIGRAFHGDDRLPVARAVWVIEEAGGRVEWLLDNAAAAQI